MIDIRRVSKSFHKRDAVVDAVRDMSLTVERQEIVAVIGPSGCGKSTLLNMIAGLYAPTRGHIVYKGATVADVNTDVGYMTQKDNLLPWRNVRDNVAFPLELAGVAKSERARRADQVIEHVGLAGFEDRFPNELSGGMRKRACLARMLLYGAETALLDEPFAALDAQLKLAMHDLVLRLASENAQTVVLVTHDLMEAVTLADRVLVCTRRPATVAMEQRIDLKRPRDVLNVRFSNEFKEFYDALWEGWPMLLCQAALGIVVLLIWQGASGRLVDNFFISNPIDVAVRLYGWTMDGSIFRHIGATVYAMTMGFFIGAVGGAILGVWLGVSPLASRLLNPYLNALNALPKVALAPLFVLWFGLGLESKIALAAVLVLFLVFLNTFAGVREVDQDLIDGARLMRATRAQVITKVIIPSAMSWVFAGLKISVPYALIGAVLGEMIAANRGLGYLVQFSGAQFDSAGVFAVLFVIALLAVGLNFLVEIVQHRMERWRIVSR